MEYLPRQRWYGASERELVAVEVVSFDLVQKDWPALAWALCEARFADGTTMTYQLFIGARPVAPPIDFLHGKEKVTLGNSEIDGEHAVLYDALVDPDLAVAVLHMVDPSAEVNVTRPIVLEHSNSSLVFDERLILKLFRKITPGPNPDVDVPRRLAEHGFAHVMPPIAVIERDGTDLAVLREYLVGAVEGWSLAHTSMRDLLASRLPPAESGGDFAPEAARLGELVANMHVHLASAYGAQPGDADQWADRMADHLSEVCATTGGKPPFDAAAVRVRYDRLRAISDPGAAIRIHGDLHLSQVLRADAGWFVLDFEGEPARRRDQATETSSALRDVAGMLRSFHYAAETSLREWGEDSDDELAALARAWEERADETFLDAYYGTEGIDAVLPRSDADRNAVLEAFELDKAVYEVGYELGHRPDWVDTPLGAIVRLLSS
jgi:maltokinase